MRSTVIALLLTALIASRPGTADADAGKQAVAEVLLGKIADTLVEHVREKLPAWLETNVKDEKKRAERLNAAKNFARNFRTLIFAAKKDTLVVGKTAEEELLDVFVAGKTAQWEIYLAYVVKLLEKKYPTLEYLSLPLAVVGGVFTSTDANVGAAFEFCSPGMDADAAGKLVSSMLRTYSKDELDKTLAYKKSCAEYMFAYLMHR